MEKTVNNKLIIRNQVNGIDIKDVEDIYILVFEGANAFIKNFDFILDDFINLKQIEVSKNNKFYYSLDDVLFSKDKKELILYPPLKKNIDYEIPSFVSKLNERSFFKTDLLEKLIIPSTVTYIDKRTIGRMDNLKSLTIPFIGTSLNDSSHFCTIFNAIRREYYDKVDEYAVKTTKLDWDRPDYIEEEVLFEDKYQVVGGSFENYFEDELFAGSDIRLSESDYDHYMSNHGGYHPEHGYIWDDPYNNMGRFNKNLDHYCSLPTTLKELIILDGDSIGGFNLANFNSLERLVLPSSIQYIGQGALVNTSISSLVIPDNTKLHQVVRYDNSHNLDEFYIPKNANMDILWLIGTYNKIKVSKDNKYFKVEDNVLYTKDMKQLLKYPLSSKKSEFIIPKDIEIIHCQAFFGQNYLKTLVLNDEVKELIFIGFYGSKIEEIIVPKTNKNFIMVDGTLYNKDKSEVIWNQKRAKEIIKLYEDYESDDVLEEDLPF